MAAQTGALSKAGFIRRSSIDTAFWSVCETLFFDGFPGSMLRKIIFVGPNTTKTPSPPIRVLTRIDLVELQFGGVCWPLRGEG